MKNLGYYNGYFGELDGMYIPMNDRVCAFGDGVYDAAYCYNHRIFALEEHIERFFESTRLLKLNTEIKEEELAALLQRLANRVDDDKLFIYWQATRGTQQRQHTFDRNIKANLWVTVKHGELRDMSKPISVMLAPDMRHKLCNIKTLNLIPNILAAQEAEEKGLDEVIFHRDGRITECAHSNVSIISNGKLITPPSDNLILSGIGRAHLIKVCEKLGIECEKREFFIEDLFGAEEIIITAAGSLCLDVGKLDGTDVGGGAKDLLKKIRDMLIAEFNNFTESDIVVGR